MSKHDQNVHTTPIMTDPDADRPATPQNVRVPCTPMTKSAHELEQQMRRANAALALAGIRSQQAVSARLRERGSVVSQREIFQLLRTGDAAPGVLRELALVCDVPLWFLEDGLPDSTEQGDLRERVDELQIAFMRLSATVEELRLRIGTTRLRRGEQARLSPPPREPPGGMGEGDQSQEPGRGGRR